KEPSASASPALDFDLGGTTQKITPAAAVEDAADKTMVLKREEASGAIDFNLDLGGGAKPAEAPAAAAPAAKPPPSGLDFDLHLDGDKKADASASAAAPSMDLSAISLDLGTPGEAAPAAPAGGSDPKWQEVATKLDLAKAYEEMGDKDGARELLNEVMKD